MANQITTNRRHTSTPSSFSVFGVSSTSVASLAEIPAGCSPRSGETSALTGGGRLRNWSSSRLLMYESRTRLCPRGDGEPVEAFGDGSVVASPGPTSSLALSAVK